MPIELDKKDGEYGLRKGKFEYTISEEPYPESNLFQKFVHKENEPSSGGTYLSFKKSKSTKNEKYFYYDSVNLNKVEIFFSKYNPQNPLVLGIFAGQPRYFGFSYLNNAGGRLTGKWFGESQLLDNLIAENNKLNNVITYRLDKTKPNDPNYDGVDVSVEQHPSFDKYKHTPLKKAENTPAYVLYKGHQIKLDTQIQFRGKPKLDKIQNKCYTEVTVFFYKQVKGKPHPNLPIFLVLQEKPQTGGDGTNNTYCLQRADDHGLKWKQINNPNLDTVITFLIDKKENGVYNGSIDVKLQTHNSFNVYEHAPQSDYQGRKAYLLYEFKFLELEKKTKTEVTQKLSEIHFKCYKTVKTYYFKAERNNFNATIPIYLELEEKTEQGQSDGSTKKYHLQRTGGRGIQWKQINDPTLSNTITYLLDQKLESGKTYNNSVTVEKGNHVSFDVYIHKPTKDSSMGLLLYNSSLLFFDNTKLPENQRLDKLEFKNYCEIRLYYFKLSNNGSHEIPTYIELKIKETTTGDSQPKSYYLEREGQNSIYWKQIKDPELGNVITFLLDNKTGSYNDSSITVIEKTDPSFKFITHTPGSQHANKKGILRFNDKDLVLVPNEQLGTGVDKLKDFNGLTYSSVTLFYYNASNQNTLPVFLELQINGTTSGENQQDCTNNSKCYLLKRADEVGTKWTQIDYQNLKETVTYQLEFTKNGQSYNDNSVAVTMSTQDSFNVYTHTATKPDNLALFLYNWHMLTLQPNDDTEITNLLSKLHGNKYCRVCVYYSQTYRDQPPLFLELFKNSGGDGSSECTESTNSISYWLERVDPEGHHWKQITKPDLGEQKAQEIVTQVRTNDKNSIMVRLTEKAPYNMYFIKHYRTDNIGEPTNPFKTIYSNMRSLSTSNYQYYDHTFSESRNLSGYGIEKLRTFIKGVEVKQLKTGGSEQKLEYNPNYESDKQVSVFFTRNDHVPLLLFYDDKWYGPNNKDEYFVKWNQNSNLEAVPSNGGSQTSKLTGELDKINKQFNEILLNNTSSEGYGISVPQGREPPSGFDTKRVNVKPESATSLENKFGKVTHSTSNKSSIGKIMLGKEELQDGRGTKLSEVSEIKSGTFIGVSAFYYKNDSEYTKPLLLGFMKTGSRNNAPEAFYERQSSDDKSQWKKITQITDLRNNEGLANKINNIHYNIGKSVVMRVDHQGQDGSGDNSYPVKLVDNKGDSSSGSNPTPAGGNKNITVKKGECGRLSITNYICFTHTIPEINGSTSSEDTTSTHYISGLKLYVCDIYLETHTGTGSSPKLPIYYNPEHRDVKVYFYQHGTSGTSNTPIDKVPLLVEYNGTHYKPEGRDTYFTKWIEVKVFAGDARGDNIQPKSLQDVLEDINKDLNQIQLETNNNGSYGLKKPTGPPEVSTCASTTPVSTFCNRVTVTRENGDGAGNYLKVTHTTNNKGPIGDFKYGGSDINGIKVEGNTTTCNQVDVYYKVGDDEYKNPLLIHISADSGARSSTCTGKWFHRIGIKPTDWNDYDNKDGQLSTRNASNIKAELDKIQTSLSNYLLLNLENQKPYPGCVQKGSEESGKKYSIGTIKASASYGGDSHKAQNYRHYQHYLSNFYSTYKEQIGTTLELESQGDDPTLQVRIYLVSSYIINFLGTDGEQPLSNPLTYGPTEAGHGTSNDPFVYFYDPETHIRSSDPDTVPLLFKYGERYFVPNSKDEYFKKWKEVTINTRGDQKAGIKKHLDNINTQLNEIYLKETGGVTGPGGRTTAEYGLPDPGGGRDALTPGFDTKRITVNKQENLGNGEKKYTTISHTTTNGYNIGDIKALGTKCTFDNKHTSTLTSQAHNQAVAVYAGAVASTTGALQNPSLVLITESTRTGNQSTVLGYYNLSGGCPNGGTQYTFKPVKSQFTVDQLSDKATIEKSCQDLVEILETLGIVKKEVQTRAPALPPDSAPSQEEGGLDEGQDDRPKVGAGGGSRSDGDHDAIGGSGGMGAGGKHGQGVHTEDGAPGQKGDSGQQTNHTVTSSAPDLGHTTTTHEVQPHQPRDGGDLRREEGVAGPQGVKGEKGAKGGPGSSSTSAQSNPGGFEGFIKQAGEFFQQPVGYGSASAVGGVGVIGGVGAVVYKKCVVGSAVAAGKEAVEMRYFVVVKPFQIQS